MENIRPNEQRAKTAIALIWIICILELASLLSGYFQYNLLQDGINGRSISLDEANANDMREQMIGIVSLLAYIISGITFILWFRRAYFNLHQRIEQLSYTDGWAAGSWFVPILNLFRPYQIMRELYTETHDLLQKQALITNESSGTIAIGWWWGLWITNNVIGQFIFRFSMNSETIDDFSLYTVASMVGNIIGIILSVVTVKVIKGYANLEEKLKEIKEGIPATGTVITVTP